MRGTLRTVGSSSWVGINPASDFISIEQTELQILRNVVITTNLRGIGRCCGNALHFNDVRSTRSIRRNQINWVRGLTVEFKLEGIVRTDTSGCLCDLHRLNLLLRSGTNLLNNTSCICSRQQAIIKRKQRLGAIESTREVAQEKTQATCNPFGRQVQSEKQKSIQQG